jgi:hypothetical protein
MAKAFKSATSTIDYSRRPTRNAPSTSSVVPYRTTEELSHGRVFGAKAQPATNVASTASTKASTKLQSKRTSCLSLAVLCRWQDPTMSIQGPYHDQGFLDLPLESTHYGPPERIETILDLDLGQYSLTTFSASSHFGNPSPVFRSLCKAIDMRKLDVCFTCFESQAPKGPGALRPALPQLTWLETAQATGPIQPCHCTLRKHIVDRWVCLRCYEGEVHAMAQATSSPCGKTGLCRCGSHDAMYTLCLWCWGEITEEDVAGRLVDETD